MIKLRTKTKYFYFNFAKRIITTVSVFPVAIYFLYIFILSLINKDIQTITLNQMMLLYCSIPFLIVNLFFVAFGAFYKRYLNNCLLTEFYEIVSSTKLIKKMPKVVYVYTCHDDMYESRVLQNIQQTYQNIEVWISEGSEKPEVIEKSKKFADRNKLNFFAVGGKGSANKADNLNAFLKKSGVTFDYLLITDSDESLHRNFVEYAIKCFCWEGFINLGFVTPQNYSYDTKSLFSNIFLNFDNLGFKKHAEKTYSHSYYANLYSASCLISKDLLSSNNGLFPSGCLEDAFLESESLRNGFTSVIIPICPCSQAFDKSIKAYQKRTLRIQDWIILLAKKDKVHRYNEKYTNWWAEWMPMVYYPILLIFRVIGISLLLWIIFFHTSAFLNNIFILVTTVYSLCILIINFLLKNLIVFEIKKYGNKHWLLFLLLEIQFNLVSIPYRLKHCFNALFLGKYSEFGGSGQKAKKTSKLQPIRWDIVMTLIFGLSLSALTLGFHFGLGWDNQWYGLAYIMIATILSVFTLAFISEIILYGFGFINDNPNYSKDDFIELPEAYKFKKIKDKFIKEHKDDPRYDLSCLE